MLIWILLRSLFVLIASGSAVNDVHVSMTANFDSVPLIFEIAEFFHDHHSSNDHYFEFIDEFIDFYHHRQCNDVSACPSAQSIYEWATAKDSFPTSIGRTAMESLEFALALKHYTPRIAMFEQMYQSQIHSLALEKRMELVIIHQNINNNNAPQVIAIEDGNESIKQIQSTLDALDTTATAPLINSNWPIFKSHDHWIGTANNVLIIYYGDYLSDTFGAVYKYLRLRNDFCFVLRPISLRPSLSEFNLQGYGVELAIKNMEYSVIDDRNVQSVQVDADGNVKHSAVQQQQEKKEKNDIFHQTFDFLQSLLFENESVPNLLEMPEDDRKQYMNSLDIQATKALIAAYNHCQDKIKQNKGEKDLNKIKVANDNFLAIFREFSTNAPRYVQTISHIKAETFGYLLPYLQTMQRYQREGQQSFALNGINLAVAEFDIFNFYNTLHKEAKFVDSMKEIMQKYDADYQNNKLITKLLSTPFEMLSFTLSCCLKLKLKY